MKKTLILISIFTLFITGCTFNQDRQPSVTTPPQSEEQTVELGEISFQVPADFQIEQNPSDALVAIYGNKDPQSGVYLFSLKVYENKTLFSSFEDFANDLETNFIIDQIKSNNPNLTETEIDTELQKFKNRYSFERKEINDINVILHKRDFFGMIGNIFDMYLFLDNGKVLHFSSESDHELLKQVYFSIKK